ncbi:MAG: ACP S-malonyltransferase [Burkholderiaceae bacterium]
MKFAFVFPGQGSQSIGMLNAFAQNRAVQETLAEASEVLHEDIGRLIAEGPGEKLGLTTVTQPVMLTADVAIWRAWRAAGGAPPALAAGHSLGEYAALVAAGVLSLSEALPLVRFRATAMQSATPVGVGSMAAILGLPASVVGEICRAVAEGEVVEPANFNDPAQTVISGHTSAVERACAAAKDNGAKRAVLLAVSAPFHCSLMQPAAEALQSYLKDKPFATPQIDVLNNVDVSINPVPDLIKDALVRQAWRAVRWVEIIERMRADGVTHVVECGPGKVLLGLTKRIDREAFGAAIVDPESLAQILEMTQCR